MPYLGVYEARWRAAARSIAWVGTPRRRGPTCVVTPLVISGISRIVIPCTIALLVAIAISVSIVVRSLVVIARLARVVGIGDSHEFIIGSASGEHGDSKEYGNQFHD